MATDFYITKNDAPTYNSKAAPRGIYVPKGTMLECDWLWTKGALIGMRKIVSGDYANSFVKGSDLDKYVVPPPPTDPPDETMPPPDEAEFRWKNEAGEIIITQIWIPKP